MGRIVELPESVRVRIAAGEVIERPASVVKELVENAFDAGASSVTVELAGGGRDLIRVTDDGCGMSREDLVLSIRRHATSKLDTAEDLARIETMGFRGEALASVGSVSTMRIVTREHDGDAAWEITVNDGVELPPVETAAAPGTIVEVLNLFRNVPVRRNFLRSAGTEAGRSGEAVLGLALSRPDVAVRYVSDGREVFSVAAQDELAGRVASLVGPDIASNLVPIEAGECNVLHLSGLIAPPSVSRASRGHIHVFINGRPVKEPVIARALQDGYAGSLAPRRFPVAFLFLTIAHDEVDVNVHPAKREVRLRSPQSIFRLVHGAVKETLGRLRPEAGFAGGRDIGSALPPCGVPARSSGMPTAARDVSTYDMWAGERRYEKPGGFGPPGASADADADAGGAAGPAAGAVRFVGQTSEGYLVAEVGDELRILDPHALHERVIYERLGSRERSAESQALLTPLTLELTPSEAALLETLGDDLAGLGFEVGAFGGSAILVRSVPSIIRPGSAEQCLRDLIDRGGDSRAPAGEIRDRMLASVACAGAIKLGERMTADQAVSLIEDAEASGIASVCPHGRATSLVVGKKELERRFGR